MNVWRVALNDLRMFWRDIPGLIYLIATPIVIIMVASFALSGMFTKGEVEQFSVPIVIEDGGEAATTLVDSLKDTSALKLIETEKDSTGKKVALTRKRAKQMVTDKKAAIIIPEGFSEKVAQGEKAEVILLEDPSDQVVPSVVREIVSKLTTKQSLAMSIQTVGGEAVQGVVAEAEKQHGVKVDPQAALEKIKEQSQDYVENPPVQVAVEDIAKEGSAREVTAFETNVPGYAVMFVLLGATSAAMSLLDERTEGTLRKLQTMPISRFSILGGKFLSSFLKAMFQMLVLFLVGHFAFGMWLGNSFVGLLLMVIVTSFAATGLGMLIAAICKTRAQAQGISLLIVLAMSALGGSWWPLSIAPEWLQTTAYVTLTAWAMSGFNQLLIYGHGLMSILPPLTVLAGAGVVFLLLSVRLFRFN